MPILKRHKTDYKGVYFIWGESITPGKQQKIFYVRYRKDGKAIDEKAGRQIEDDMTPARASIIRAERISGKRQTNEERRQEIEKERRTIIWTISKIWDEYAKVNAEIKGLRNDHSVFKNTLSRNSETRSLRRFHRST